MDEPFEVDETYLQALLDAMPHYWKQWNDVNRGVVVKLLHEHGYSLRSLARWVGCSEGLKHLTCDGVHWTEPREIASTNADWESSLGKAVDNFQPDLPAFPDRQGSGMFQKGVGGARAQAEQKKHPSIQLDGGTKGLRCGTPAIYRAGCELE